VADHAEPTVPFGKDDVGIDTGVVPDAMLKLNDLLAVCGVELESLTCTVKETVPAAVGVPLNCPVEAFRLSQEGKEEPDQV